MSVIVASKAGYCFGVKRAVKKAYDALKKNKTVYSPGPLIHNEQAMDDMKKNGLLEVEKIEDIPDFSVVTVRSHGWGKSGYNLAELKNLSIVDLTCPFVNKIHNIVRKNYSEGKKIIIIGDKTHPEVKGVNDWADNKSIIGEKTEDFTDLKDDGNFYTVVTQTTFKYEKYQEIKKFLQENIKNIFFYDTICDATRERQEEALALSSKVDAIIVLGGKNSSNTKKLYEICKQNCKKTFFAETLNDIDENEIKLYDSVGITAGASTPDFIIESVAVSLGCEKNIKELD